MNTKDTQEEHIHFRISKQLKDEFKAHCLKEGYGFSNRIKALMRKECKSENK